VIKTVRFGRWRGVEPPGCGWTLTQSFCIAQLARNRPCQLIGAAPKRMQQTMRVSVFTWRSTESGTVRAEKSKTIARDNLLYLKLGQVLPVSYLCRNRSRHFGPCNLKLYHVGELANATWNCSSKMSVLHIEHVCHSREEDVVRCMSLVLWVLAIQADNRLT
jgi:hypothetical protein